MSAKRRRPGANGAADEQVAGSSPTTIAAKSDMLTVPRPRATTEHVTRLLAVIAGDPLHASDRRRIVVAIVSDAIAHHGRVDPNRVRRALTNKHGRTVYPRVIGATYQALVRSGDLVFDQWVTNDDARGGNAGRPARAYRLDISGGR